MGFEDCRPEELHNASSHVRALLRVARSCTAGWYMTSFSAAAMQAATASQCQMLDTQCVAVHADFHIAAAAGCAAETTVQIGVPALPERPAARASIAVRKHAARNHAEGAGCAPRLLSDVSNCQAVHCRIFRNPFPGSRMQTEQEMRVVSGFQVTQTFTSPAQAPGALPCELATSLNLNLNAGGCQWCGGTRRAGAGYRPYWRAAAKMLKSIELLPT